MAGTFGMLHRNYRSSLRAGWGLISKLRNPAIQAGTTECSSCRIQMEQGTTKRTIHPIKLLALAYGLMPEVASMLTTPGEEPYYQLHWCQQLLGTAKVSDSNARSVAIAARERPVTYGSTKRKSTAWPLFEIGCRRLRETLRSAGWIRKTLIEYPNGDVSSSTARAERARFMRAGRDNVVPGPFRNSNLASPEAWERAEGHCPGCSHGKLVTLDKIEEQRKVMPL